MKSHLKPGLIPVVCVFIGILYGFLTPVPEPESCSLCAGRRYHAPCLLNLSTGEVGELQVYDPKPEAIYEIAEHQQTGTFSFLSCADLTGWRDTDNHTAQVTVPKRRSRIAEKYFCANCRAILKEIADRGYVLLDLYDLGHIRAYSIHDGASYSVRDYSVDIYRVKEPDGLHVKVTGSYHYAIS